jgi:hypothetical protein
MFLNKCKEIVQQYQKTFEPKKEPLNNWHPSWNPQTEFRVTISANVPGVDNYNCIAHVDDEVLRKCIETDQPVIIHHTENSFPKIEIYVEVPVSMLKQVLAKKPIVLNESPYNSSSWYK